MPLPAIWKLLSLHIHPAPATSRSSLAPALCHFSYLSRDRFRLNLEVAYTLYTQSSFTTSIFLRLSLHISYCICLSLSVTFCLCICHCLCICLSLIVSFFVSRYACHCLSVYLCLSQLELQTGASVNRRE